MDNSNIEKKGISVVTEYLCDMGYIAPYLNSDDKIPMWDGFLYVYKVKEGFSNETFDYSIPVQVKTTYIKNSKLPESTTFDLSIVDLKNYQKDGGLVFFKVLFNDEKEKGNYCAFLTKDSIENILQETKDGQQSKSIKLNKAPSDYKILLENLKRINLQRCLQPIDVTDLSKYNDIKFSFTIEHEPSDINVYEYIATHPLDLVVTSQDFPGKFYTKGGPGTLHVTKFVKSSVIVGGRIFYNSFKIASEQDGYHYYFGDSVDLIMPYKEDGYIKPGFNIKINANTIDKIILDLEFIISMFENKRINTSVCQIDIDGIVNDTTEDIMKMYNCCLLFWKDVNTLFTILHIECSLNPDSISDNDEQLLRILIQSLVYNKPVSGDEEGDKIHLFQIAGMDIYVFAKHIEGRKYQLQDIYDRFCATYKDENNMIQPLPLQSLFWELEKLPANLVYNNLIEQYKKYKENNPKIAIQANQDLLNMLKHYDRCHDIKLLDAAIELAMWLRNEGVNENLSFLNYIQTKLRKDKELNDDDRKQLYLLQASNDIEDFARYLLLGNKEKAMTFWEKIPENDRIFLSTLPIYHFMNE